jgi:flavin-binding protein dodecin
MSPRHAASALRRASQLVRNIQVFEKIKIKIRSGVCQWGGQLTKINYTITAAYE